MPLRILPAAEADATRAFEIEHLAYKAVNDPISSLMVCIFAQARTSRQ
jgi:hypothetical protein